MTKTWQFRAFSLYLTLGIPLAASCAKEANTLEGEETEQGGSNTGKAGTGNNNQAGTLAKAGTTGTNAFGGTTSTAGKGSAGTEAAEGGEASVAGTSSGGKGGATAGGSGGAGGSGTTVPPDVLARADVIVYYETSHTTASDKIIQMKLYVENKSADPLPMANVKIRYWFTAEATPTLHQYYTGAEAQMPKAAFVDSAANSHALLTFGGGSIVKGGDRNKSEIQLEISGPTAFTQTGDHSWEPTSTTSKPNDRVTLYLDDELIWGCEPSGKCFGDDTGAGGAGTGGAGAGGAGGAAQ